MSTIPQQIAGEPVSSDQATYLDGFFSGMKNRGLSFADVEPDAGPAPKAKKIIAEEKIKRELDPFDALPVLHKQAKTNEAPEKEDIFRFKWNGLFWLGPMHEGYMCRLRIPGGTVNSNQFRELANIADDIAWGYLQLTTRNNVQLRVIEPKNTPELLRRIQDCGLHSKGSGADNLRNFTANPTSGLDPHELYDVMPLIHDLSHYIINQPEFYDLPRKFNISYDSGAPIRVAEDTNDIGLQAIKLKAPPEGHPLHGKIEEGVHFRILLGGVSGHQELAEDCGAICSPENATDVVTAMTRAYIRNGNRSSRGKSRLIYLLKDWGYEKFLAESEQLLDEPIVRFDFNDPVYTELIEPHEKPMIPHPHIGAHAQKQEGLSMLGVYVPVGLLQTDEARAIANVADEFGTGELRLTIFQNVIIPNIATDKIESAKARLAEAGLGCEASNIRGGAAACTGNRYCKFASSDTKGNTIDLVDYLDSKMTLDLPINIHVTGCPHSCAQHYVGDIGLLACKVPVEGQDEPVEGYHVFIGGGFGGDQKRIGRQLLKSVAVGPELNGKIEALLKGYLANRDKGETFLDFTGRHNLETLEALVTE